MGGNALQTHGAEESVAADFARTAATADSLLPVIAEGAWRIVITHGNGPQVGNHLLRSELASHHGDLPDLPLEVCVADTQGGMGYMLQQCLTNALGAAGVTGVVTTVVTQVVVDPDDAAFADPNKPVGSPIPPERVLELKERGWMLIEDRSRGGWRRVVPSPDPREIVEAEAIRALVERGVIVIAAGGGGVPVVQDERGELRGVHAVVDKDLASALLAADLKATGLLILTDVERVALDFESDAPRFVDEMTVAEARRYLAEGQFPPGSMGPKVEALCRFVERGGALAAVASIEQCRAAAGGRAGTRITV